LPPVQQGRELDSLDSAGDSETKEQPVEMSFHGSSRHFELIGDFSVVTTLQKQFHNLLFARSQSNGLLFHQLPLLESPPAQIMSARTELFHNPLHPKCHFEVNRGCDRRTIDFHNHFPPQAAASTLYLWHPKRDQNATNHVKTREMRRTSRKYSCAISHLRSGIAG